MSNGTGGLDYQAASRLIVEEVRRAPPAASTGAPEGAAAGIDAGDFCSIWEAAKPILQAIAAIVGFIPGLPGTAGAVLRGLIEIGDKIHDAQCG